MTRKGAARILDPETTRDQLWEYEVDTYIEACNEACRMGADALRAQQEQTPCSYCGYGGKHLDAPPCTTCPAHPKEHQPNAPLNLDELRKMDGEPVFLVDLVHKSDPEVPDLWGGWIVFTKHDQNGFIPRGGGFFSNDGYGKTWLAYRQKPKGE